MRRGPLYMILAALTFSVMVALVKHVRADMATLEVMIWRGIVSVPITWVIARPVGLRLHNVPLFAVRALLGFGAMIGYFTAAKGLLVADVSLISRLHPMLVALLAPFVLGAAERAGATVWLVLVVGLAGCALILAPDLAVGSVYGLYCLGAAASSAAAHVCIRGLMRTDDARVVVFHFQLVATVLALLTLVISTGTTPTMPDSSLLPYLLGIGVTATAGQLLMTHAYKEDRAAVVSAAGYAGPIWAVLIDIVIFVTMPGWHVFVGGAVIVGAGLYLVLAGTTEVDQSVDG